jgi:hypothetical protein
VLNLNPLISLFGVPSDIPSTAVQPLSFFTIRVRVDDYNKIIPWWLS